MTRRLLQNLTLVLLLAAAPRVAFALSLFGSRETRELAYESPLYSGVAKLWMANGGYCTSFLIRRSWLLTAAHCLHSNPVKASFEYSDGKHFEFESKVTAKWIARDYRPGCAMFQADFALIRLETPAPARYRSYRLANARDIQIGQPAMSIGYPLFFKRGGDVRVVDSACSVKNLVGDSILSSCNMSRGNSGGPLLVKNRKGEWVAAGICSTQILKPDGNMFMYVNYSDDIANQWTNVSGYALRIAKTVLANPPPK